jgi:hypothetical protein
MATHGADMLVVLLDSDVSPSNVSRLPDCDSWSGTSDLQADYRFFVPES